MLLYQLYKFRVAGIVWGKVTAKLFIGPPSETNFENPKLAPGIFEANFLLVLSKCRRYFYVDFLFLFWCICMLMVLFPSYLFLDSIE